MSSRVIKLIVVTDDDTAEMLADYSMMPYKQREFEQKAVEFKFIDKHGLDHELHYVHSEEV
jgi:hypothetical protein